MTDKKEGLKKQTLRMIENYATSKDEKMFYLDLLIQEGLEKAKERIKKWLKENTKGLNLKDSKMKLIFSYYDISEDLIKSLAGPSLVEMEKAK